MKQMTKLLALLLCFSIVIGVFVGCQPEEKPNDDLQDDITETPSDDDKEDDKVEEIQTDRYVITSKIKFATNDYKMKDAVSAMNSNSIITVDKGNVWVATDSELNDVKVDKDYYLVDGTLYYSNTVRVGDIFATEHKKADMSNQNKEWLLAKVGAGAQISIADFETFDMSSFGENCSYTCSNIYTDSAESLCDILASGFAGMDASVELVNVEYMLDVKGEIYTSSILSCSFEITIDGIVYEITMHVYNDYTYSNDISITLPENADEYQQVPHSEIIG